MGRSDAVRTHSIALWRHLACLSEAGPSSTTRPSISAPRSTPRAAFRLASGPDCSRAMASSRLAFTLSPDAMISVVWLVHRRDEAGSTDNEGWSAQSRRGQEPPKGPPQRTTTASYHAFHILPGSRHGHSAARQHPPRELSLRTIAEVSISTANPSRNAHKLSTSDASIGSRIPVACHPPTGPSVQRAPANTRSSLLPRRDPAPTPC